MLISKYIYKMFPFAKSPLFLEELLDLTDS